MPAISPRKAEFALLIFIFPLAADRSCFFSVLLVSKASIRVQKKFMAFCLFEQVRKKFLPDDVILFSNFFVQVVKEPLFGDIPGINNFDFHLFFLEEFLLNEKGAKGIEPYSFWNWRKEENQFSQRTVF